MDNTVISVSSFAMTLELLLTPSVDLTAKQDNGEYEFIPLPAEIFVEQLEILAQLRKAAGDSNGHWTQDSNGQMRASWQPSFVDIGCGIGTKLILADRTWPFYLRLFGIENTPEYVHAGKTLMNKYMADQSKWSNKPMPSIVQADALTHDYSGYDIIYFYCPMTDNKKQKSLEEQIFNTAKPGAYILANLAYHKENNFPDAIERVWIKDKCQILRKQRICVIGE